MFFGRLFSPQNLWSAAKRGDTAAIERLVSEGHDVNGKRQSVDGETPLHVAARAGQLEAIRLLVNCGAKINGKDGDGMTPLMAAITEEQNTAAVEMLLTLGASPSAQDKAGMTALDHAAFSSCNKLVDLLIKRGVQLNVGEGKRRSSPIAHCVSGENFPGLKMLIAAGADVNAVDAGSSPLAAAAALGRVDYVRLLLDAGAVPSQQSDGDGYSDLMSAVAGGNLEIVKMFIKAGANKNAIHPIMRETALDIAENREKVEIATYLRSVDAKRSKELPEADLGKKSATETFWQLPNELFLSASVEPSPPKAGTASITAEIATSKIGGFAGEIEYRLTEGSRGFGAWKRLFDEKTDEDGDTLFSDEITLSSGTNVVEFRIRDEGSKDFVCPEGWKIIAT